MGGLHLGRLGFSDPLYEILYTQMCPEVGDPHFYVDRMSSRRVYKYTEEKTRVSMIGKFFRLDDPKQDRISRLKGEFDNLETMRGYGFDNFPHYVVRPISREERIGLALLEEFIQGKDLDHYLQKAIYEGNSACLKNALFRLASFLYCFHSRTRTKDHANLETVSSYFRKVVNKLRLQTVISDADHKAYLKLMDRWLDRPLLQKARNVIVHGDATPTNFLFTDTIGVAAIDLERMKYADRVLDIGMVCGEIKHAFLWRTGNVYAAEPFLRYFLETYSRHFHDWEDAFRAITFRNPFYMGMTELRIARNDYLDWSYRKRLVYEALECLRWGLRLE